MREIVHIRASGFVGSALLKEAWEEGYRRRIWTEGHCPVFRENTKGRSFGKDPGGRKPEKKVKRLMAGTETVIRAYNPCRKETNVYEDLLRE